MPRRCDRDHFRQSHGSRDAAAVNIPIRRKQFHEQNYEFVTQSVVGRARHA
jgi:hypothetical protein